MDELFAAKKETRDPKFLIHAAAEVVATARETFDYLGRAIIARRRVVHLRSPLIRLSASNWTATVNKDEIGMLASHYQGLTLIFARVINTLNSTLAPSNRLPPGCPCAIYWVFAGTRFDTLVQMPLVFFYNRHDSLFELVCAAICQANFSRPRNRSWRRCSRSLSRSSAADTESAAHISTIYGKAATHPQ